MHVSERNRLEKEKAALLFGAVDMQHASAAARAVAAETEDINLMRALEAAMAVCFMRPYTKCDFRLPADMFPPDEDESQDALLFRMLETFRDTVYAHTDAGGGRKASPVEAVIDGETVTVSYQEGWLPFPREAIAHVIDLCERLREQMLIGAGVRQKMLDGEIAVS